MPGKQPELLWVVVKVESGIPVSVEAYRDRRSAEMREQSFRGHMNLENDEAGVFEIQIGHIAPLKARKKHVDPIPEEFASYEEAAEFWDTHDTTDYPDAFRTVDAVAEFKGRHHEIGRGQEQF